MGAKVFAVPPVWRKSVPTEPGLYLAADKYGRVSLHEVLGGNEATDRRGTIVRTAAGAVLFDPDYGVVMFCGPLEGDEVFPPEIAAEIVAAIDGIPEERVRHLEEVVRQNPSSRKAKAQLEEARVALAKSRSESSS